MCFFFIHSCRYERLSIAAATMHANKIPWLLLCRDIVVIFSHGCDDFDRLNQMQKLDRSVSVDIRWIGVTDGLSVLVEYPNWKIHSIFCCHFIWAHRVWKRMNWLIFNIICVNNSYFSEHTLSSFHVTIYALSLTNTATHAHAYIKLMYACERVTKQRNRLWCRKVKGSYCQWV